MAIFKNFTKLTSTFKNSVKTWDYFVNWEKVNENTSDLEIILNKLNYLLGKSDLKLELKTLLNREPDIVRAFPALLASRDQTLDIYNIKEKTNEIFAFKEGKLSANKCYEFIVKTGLIHVFKEGGVKNLVDYVRGVEVGLDSNGRKNRVGTIMESIVDLYISDYCTKNKLEYLAQANAKKIFNAWSVEVLFDKSSRSFDFAVYNPRTKKVKLFETNFFNGGGSKLKTVCGDFKGLEVTLRAQDIDFIWITDGLGWKTTLRPLEEVYNHNDYIFNLSMLEDGILDILKW